MYVKNPMHNNNFKCLKKNVLLKEVPFEIQNFLCVCSQTDIRLYLLLTCNFFLLLPFLPLDLSVHLFLFRSFSLLLFLQLPPSPHNQDIIYSSLSPYL